MTTRKALIPADGEWHCIQASKPISAIKARLNASIDIDSNGKGWVLFPPAIDTDTGEPFMIIVEYICEGV